MNKNIHIILILLCDAVYNFLFGSEFYFNLYIFDFINTILLLIIVILFFIISIVLTFIYSKKYKGELLSVLLWLILLITGLPMVALIFLNSISYFE
ncbi:hypothetical protein ACE38V_19990 [Cytobacillus sp. Hz8]|uniref:hypothetical protein n=1 Tax=Cytobacillus sp. Hz8 TaxID=3347168 RepID=UPI0035E2178D